MTFHRLKMYSFQEVCYRNNTPMLQTVIFNYQNQVVVIDIVLCQQIIVLSSDIRQFCEVTDGSRCISLYFIQACFGFHCFPSSPLACRKLF
jgi:hypothetical protein